MHNGADLLVVDDEPIVIASVAKTVAGERLSIDSAADTKAAGDRLKTNSYRAILCDLMLPGGSGLDVLAIAQMNQPGIPVVIMTGYATLENAVTPFRLGAFDCLPKPFDVGELLGVVQCALRYSDAEHKPPLAVCGESTDRASIIESKNTLYGLGINTWALVSAPSKLVRVGMAHAFADSIRYFDRLKLPAVGEEVTQGKPCAEVSTRDGASCRVWSPLSGRVVDINARVGEDPQAVNIDPEGEGWLFDLEPSHLDSEVASLVCRDRWGDGKRS
ncbi:MAG: hypothetical protein A2341_14325 [Deltaproteobacteria bacterium RIFOXYB12_FULL_58_9]|nr:MAG: hypothetical protein A2341_14325 [Deltaproteobacteria bacterium RIFOXYB12_FULL_58_9]